MDMRDCDMVLIGQWNNLLRYWTCTCVCGMLNHVVRVNMPSAVISVLIRRYPLEHGMAIAAGCTLLLIFPPFVQPSASVPLSPPALYITTRAMKY